MGTNHSANLSDWLEVKFWRWGTLGRNGQLCSQGTGGAQRQSLKLEVQG